jgi:hypothetical protein
VSARTGRLVLGTAAFATAMGLIASAAPPAVTRLWARYWPIPADYWLGKTAWTPPEKPALDGRQLSDLGVAFSGGGTRAATATVGQLRGLQANGWLPRVRYLTAVSGGSWAAVPFTYSSDSLDVLLGAMLPTSKLTRAEAGRLNKGSLGYAIAHSRLLAPGAAEAARIVGRAEVQKREIPPQIAALANRFTGGLSSETFANLLARFFIKPFIPDGTSSRYTWDSSSLTNIKDAESSVTIKDFVRVADHRPFLIVGGTAIYQHPAYDYPRLIPVEYTPLYTGVRQQFGERLGGMYISPFAYDAASADEASSDRVRVTLKSGTRPFTLADVIASSGAAPLLALYRGVPAAQLKRATEFFPAFNHFAIRATDQGFETKPVVAKMLHGDGGFSDNLGLMPLLARQVRNILVFVNASGPFWKNESIESMFWRLDRQEDAGGDRSMNAVFDPERFWEVEAGLKRAVAANGPAVYCSENWRVRRNEIYNIAAYDGLNICWIHNERIDSWIADLPDDTKAMVSTAKGFRNFPWYATFEQNKPHLIRLTPEQVNLLGHFSSWQITDARARSAIEKVMGGALK